MRTGQAERFVQGYRFNVQVNGKDLPCAIIGEIEVGIVSGAPRYKPVELMRAHKVGEQTLAEIMGQRPWSRKNFVLQELYPDASSKGFDVLVVRSIYLTGCRVMGYKISEHNAMENELVTERIKLHPQKVRIVTHPVTFAAVKPHPVTGITPGMPSGQ